MSERMAGEPLPGSGERLLTHLFFSADGLAHDRASLASLALALALHALLVALALSPVARHLLATATDPGVGTGISAGRAGGGGGGRDEVIIALVAPPSASATETAVPPPPPQLEPPTLAPVVVPPPIQLASIAPITSAMPPPIGTSGTSGGSGTGAGGGQGAGRGPGSGGGSGGGEGGGIGSGVGPGTGRGRLMAPVPDFLLLPPTPYPAGVRGRTVVVRLAIDATGKVDDVELIPSTGDRGYDGALRRTAMGWRFHPALNAANQPVAVTYDVSLTF